MRTPSISRSFSPPLRRYKQPDLTPNKLDTTSTKIIAHNVSYREGLYCKWLAEPWWKAFILLNHHSKQPTLFVSCFLAQTLPTLCAVATSVHPSWTDSVFDQAVFVFRHYHLYVGTSGSSFAFARQRWKVTPSGKPTIPPLSHNSGTFPTHVTGLQKGGPTQGRLDSNASLIGPRPSEGK